MIHVLAFASIKPGMIERALDKMADGTFGLCGECECHIPFERLKIEPMTQHCVACKSRWEQARAHH